LKKAWGGERGPKGEGLDQKCAQKKKVGAEKKNPGPSRTNKKRPTKRDLQLAKAGHQSPEEITRTGTPKKQAKEL